MTRLIVQSLVSTHSRPKAAARPPEPAWPRRAKFQHTAARRRLRLRHAKRVCMLCFNTQPPEGGCGRTFEVGRRANGFNTQPPEGGCLPGLTWTKSAQMFQHTAARRRLRHA